MTALTDQIAAWGSWAQAAAGFSGVGAVIYAAKKGTATFRSWLGQKRAERHVEVAEKILSIAYKLERFIEAVRSPAVTRGEIESAKKFLIEQDEEFQHKTEAECKFMQIAQVYLTRLHNKGEIWNDLNSISPLAKAYFGDATQAALDVFWTQHQVIYVSAHMYGETGLDREYRHKIEADLWNGVNKASGKEDSISLERVPKSGNRFSDKTRVKTKI